MQASFDCTQASTELERLVCSDEVLASVDRALSSAYEARAGPQVASAARAAQRRWPDAHSTCVDASKAPGAAVRNEGERKEVAVRCLLRRYARQLETINEPRQDAGPRPDAASVYWALRTLAATRADARGSTGWLTASPRIAAPLRALLGPTLFYELRDFIDSSWPTLSGEYVTSSGGPLGALTLNKALLVVGPGEDVWVGILRPTPHAGARPGCVDLWSSVTDMAPPSVFDRWRSRFPRASVHRHLL